MLTVFYTALLAILLCVCANMPRKGRICYRNDVCRQKTARRREIANETSEAGTSETVDRSEDTGLFFNAPNLAEMGLEEEATESNEDECESFDRDRNEDTEPSNLAEMGLEEEATEPNEDECEVFDRDRNRGPFFHAPSVPCYSRNMSAEIGIIFEGERCVFCKAYRFRIEPPGFCCSEGKVRPPQMPEYPAALLKVFDIEKFMKNIRFYNNAFALASLGCQEIQQRGFSPTVIMQGKVYHIVDSLTPGPTESPKFAQLYFYDPSNELQHRTSLCDQLDAKIVEEVQDCLHQTNRYVKEIKSAVSLCSNDNSEISIVFSDVGPDKTYSLPACGQVSAITSPNFDLNTDVLLTTKSGAKKRISDLSRMYDPLHYVLLFPFGSDGYHCGLQRSNNNRMSPLDFYCYHLQIRDRSLASNVFLRSRRLTQQFVCDQFIKIERYRLQWIRGNQKQIRADKYRGLLDAVNEQDNNNEQAIGKRVILPPGFYGSPRWYAQCFQDCMAIVRTYGKPDLFITFTCNPDWKEIKDSIADTERPHDRPDICVRVYHAKLRMLLKILVDRGIFGRVAAYTCMIEYQKRGLPHAHILIIFSRQDKIRKPAQVDRIISAEIPDQEHNPVLYTVVTKNMLHGPCGHLNPAAACSKTTKHSETCNKFYPKKANNGETVITTNLHYPEYRRRDVLHGGNTCTKMVRGREITLDNSWVVPYSPILSELFNAHINVEVVMHIGAVKYLYKYVTKGTDKIMYQVEHKHDEVETFQVGRFVSATEAFWRMYQFKINFKKPTVKRLPIHLENEQTVFFQMNNLNDALDAGEPKTELLAYFDLNKSDPSARNILYPDIAQSYTWNQRDKIWKRRKLNISAQKSGKLSDAIGRIPVINLNPKQEELYYLRICLYHLPGAQCFADLRTVEGVQYHTFKEACVALGLLEDDREFHKALHTAATKDFGKSMRELFSTILAHGSPVDPVGLWNEHKKSICLDYVRQGDGLREYTDCDFNQGLCEIQEMLDGFGLHLEENFGIPFDSNLQTNLSRSKDMGEDFDYAELKRISTESIEMLTTDQRCIFDIVMDSVNEAAGRCFAIDAPGGSGKSTVITTVLATVRARGQTAIATAISGIAATLLPKGRTLHSALKVPIDLNEFSVCNITPKDKLAEQLRSTKLLVIDEVTMAHKHVYEAVDRTLRDILNPDKIFGGLTVLLAGDWRQILPVIQRGSKAEILNACLKNSYLWPNIEKLYLQKNLRLLDNPDNVAFAEYLLAVGEGRIKVTESSLDDIEIPQAFRLEQNTIEELCNFVFGEKDWNNLSWIIGRAILAPTNDAAGEINDYMIEQMPGCEKEYLSADSIVEETGTFTEFPPEFVNAVRLQGVPPPPHKLRIKTGCPVMLLRNLDPVHGHCNGSRYVIRQAHQHLIEATVAFGPNVGMKKLIPRIPMFSKDVFLPFRIKRTQFPVRLSFGMTMNKAQGQSLLKLGIYLSQDVFSHGQLYVALSRVRESSSIKISSRNDRLNVMKNVVFPEILKH